jgi:hypothetical protein
MKPDIGYLPRLVVQREEAHRSWVSGSWAVPAAPIYFVLDGVSMLSAEWRRL